MTTRTMAGFVLSAVIACAVAVPAAAAQDNGPSFVPQLLARLSDEGWSPQETAALSEAAARLDWSGAQAADAEAVALALTLQDRDMVRDRDRDTGQDRDRLRLTATDQAQLALALALMTAEMKAVGFDTHDTAVTAVAAVRNALGDIRAWMEGGRHGELGQLIRARVAAAVRQQVRTSASGQPAGRGPDSGGVMGPAGAPADLALPVSAGGGNSPGRGR